MFVHNVIIILELEQERFEIFDNEKFEIVQTKALSEDPNQFETELKKYKDQLKLAKENWSKCFACICKQGKNNLDIICSSFDFNFNGGTLSFNQDKTYEACEYAVKNKAAALTVFLQLEVPHYKKIYLPYTRCPKLFLVFKY